MLALSQSRWLRLLTFGALYLAQGVPAGFVAVGYVIFMSDQGLNYQAIGSTIGLMFLPWTFKILWAPLLDRIGPTRFGRRRPIIIAAELTMGAALLCLLFLDPKRQLSHITVALFLFSLFASIQDTATDALAVDVLQPDENATANGVMWAGRTIGTAIGGGGGVVLAKRLGWPALIVVITGIVWAVMLLVVLIRERPRSEVSEARERQPRFTLAELRRSFNFATPLVGIAIAMLTPAGSMLSGVVWTRLLRVDVKLSEDAIGLLQGLIEPAAGVAGALAGGVLADRLGGRKIIAAMMACQAVTMAVFALAPGLWTSFTFLAVIAAAGQLFMTAHTAATIGLCMKLSNPAVGATQFTLYMAVGNLTAAWATPLGGYIADTASVSAVFAVAAVANVVFIGLLPFCDPRVAEARFRPELAGAK